MKKKIIAGLGVALLTLSIGSAVFAAGDDIGGKIKDVYPHMKQVHPEMTEEQLNDMYQNCHNNEVDGTNMQNMMQSGTMMQQDTGSSI